MNMYTLWTVSLYIQDQIIFIIREMEEMKLSFIERDLLYTGDL
jgi:hypothetical protein